ncbi:MAG: YbhB/YbcL family Raf kinase inhibitor-like protein [Planctomycetota bacterium]
MSHRHRLPCRVLGMFTLLLAPGCGGTDAPTSEFPKTNNSKEVETMQLTSSELEHGAQIDALYTADGKEISPPLSWSGAPEGTKSFALICDDPDAPSPKRPAPQPWVHWVLFNIPADVTQLPQGISAEAEPEEVSGARQGVNSSSNVGYQGPAPPPGSGQHRYFFKLYALDTTLELAAGTTTKKELLDAMSGHVLAQGELMGVYER